MFSRGKIPKIKDMNKIEKLIMMISLLFTIVAIILMFLYRMDIVKYNLWPFSFSFSLLMLTILYFKYDRITAMVAFLLMFLFIGMGLKSLGL